MSTNKKLVIVESPAKAKTINKILGADYLVKSSMGHVRDLPVKKLGVDIKHEFKPRYVLVKGRKKIIDDLKKAAETCDAVYLAPDPDREGEAIAWHLKALLGGEADRYRRVFYNEVTPGAVRKAFENPGEIDIARVNAQQARRILDRIVGYMVSPMLWRRIGRGLSAGRVQSVALRLVCEREAEIRKFVPEEYWILWALVRKIMAPLDPFKVRLVRINGEKAEVTSAEQAEKILAELEGRSMKVSKVATKEVTRRPSPPHITSTLQQAGSTYCGYSPKRTMSVAQKLYEGVDLGDGPVGLITYMRTDSFTVSSQALDACRGFITQTLGPEYCPEKPNFYKSRASAQEAHEAIRPTDVSRTPESMEGRLGSAELKVYRLIWQRFVASQMTPAKIEQRSVEVDAPPPGAEGSLYTFRATSSDVKFPGFMKVHKPGKKKQDEDSDEIDGLPEVAEGEPLICLELSPDRKETKPPARYSEASLVRAMESNGVGRPSTYAQIISTLHQRRYVTRENKALAPTELGDKVSGFLVEKLGELFDVTFTAAMEESLDEVEKGSVEWTNMLKEFYTRFDGWMEKSAEPPADLEAVKRILEATDSVTEWAPEVKRGKRVYSDKKFVDSIRRQAEEGKKAISQRQLEALLRIACRYREHAPEIDRAISDSGLQALAEQSEFEPPLESTKRKLEILDKLELDASAQDFTDSLRVRVAGARRLSEAQVRALDNIVLAHEESIDGFEQIKGQLDIGASLPEERKESAALVNALAKVQEWHPPTKRRGRVYNDREFYESLSSHFSRKGFLSVKQRAALKRVAQRYHAQIPGYEELEKEVGLTRPKS